MNRDRLASVMRIRQIQERSARGALAVRRRSLRSAVAAEQQTWLALDDRQVSLSGTRSATDLFGECSIAAAGILAAGTQRADVHVAEAAVEVAALDWRVAARRVEGLERLAERTRSTEPEEAVRRSANEIDDLVLVRFTGDHV